MKNVINSRLENLRALMAAEGIDTFLLTKFDPHQFEYAKPYWNCVNFISGFTGSAGTVAVTKDKAVLWTDGRYSVQSKRELEGTEYEIIMVSSKEAADYMAYIIENTPDQGVIAFDERSLSLTLGRKLQKDAAAKGIALKSGIEVLSRLWPERVRLTDDQVFVHDLRYCGDDRKKKLAAVREKMAENKGECYILSSLDDIAWLYNLRAKSNATLTFEAYSLITADKSILFVDKVNLSSCLGELEKDGVEVLEYDSFFEYMAKYFNGEGKKNKTIICPGKSCYAVEAIVKGVEVKEIDYDITTCLKAVKNKVEIENNKLSSIRDGASLVKFIKWMKENAAAGVTEYEAGKKLDSIRMEDEKILCPSFSTILGVRENGALNHYKADQDNCLTIEPEGFLLVDSGGNYLDGTTDITRTIVLGPITEEMKRNFTLVLKSHIAMATLKFIAGSSGHYIDAIVRKPLWDYMLDYKHGTGHGIGFALSVHEGPHNLGSGVNNAKLEAGMLVSNEPGFYVEGEYGIRSENIVLVKECGETAFGKFLGFETISYCPFDLQAVDPSLLTQEEKTWLNDYHDQTYEKLSPYLNEDEKQWLKGQVQHIS